MRKCNSAVGCAGRFALAWEGKEGFPVDKILRETRKAEAVTGGKEVGKAVPAEDSMCKGPVACGNTWRTYRKPM